MDEKMVFANNLNKMMEKHGKSQSDLIAELGINKSTISTWCNGTKMPRMGTIQTLADYFGIMKSDLIEEKPAPQEDELSMDKQRIWQIVMNLTDQQARAVRAHLELLLAEDD